MPAYDNLLKMKALETLVYVWTNCISLLSNGTEKGFKHCNLTPEYYRKERTELAGQMPMKKKRVLALSLIWNTQERNGKVSRSFDASLWYHMPNDHQILRFHQGGSSPFSRRMRLEEFQELPSFCYRITMLSQRKAISGHIGILLGGCIGRRPDGIWTIRSAASWKTYGCLLWWKQNCDTD